MLLKPRAVKEDIPVTSNTGKQSDGQSGDKQQSAKSFSGEYLTYTLIALLAASDCLTVLCFTAVCNAEYRI